MEIIPAIDIIDGKCVRLEKGDYQKKKVYDDDPVKVAKTFEDAGIRRLHLVDLDGAKAKHVVNGHVLKSICSETNLKVDFGGGVKSDDDLEKVLQAGASQVTGGSIAAQNRELFLSWLDRYGADKIILGADVLDKKIMVAGWQQGTAVDLMDFLDYYTEKGITHVICTDVLKDGMLQGPAVDLYQEVLRRFPAMRLIASGGVSEYDDLLQLQDVGVHGVILGKALYENRISLDQLANFE